MKTRLILKNVALIALVMYSQLTLSEVSKAQTQYYSAKMRISPDSCILMSITMPITGAVTATTTVIADDTSAGVGAFGFGSVTIDSFGNFSVSSGTSGWIVFFNSTQDPVPMAEEAGGFSGGYITCDCSSGSGCLLRFPVGPGTNFPVKCVNNGCSGNCDLILNDQYATYHGPAVLLSGSGVNFNGVLFGSP
jgi:hypothetical protein